MLDSEHPLPIDVPLYPQMAVEKFRPIRFRPLVLLVFAPVLFMLAANLVVLKYLETDQLNQGQVIVRHKWELLSSGPRDVLVLGDSSINQGIDTTLIQERTGSTSVNLATIGTFGFMDDVWMLETYLQYYGPPQTVLVFHTFDVPPRSIDLVPLLGVYAIPLDALESNALSLQDRLQIGLTRLFPLYYRRETLRAVLEDRGSTTPQYSFDPSGFMHWTEARPDRVRQAAARTLEEIEDGSLSNSFSPQNLQALERLVILADTHDFELFLGNGPVYQGLEHTPAFVAFRRSLHETYREVAAPNPRVTYLEPVFTFEAEQMEGLDHLIAPAARDYTLAIIDLIWSA